MPACSSSSHRPALPARPGGERLRALQAWTRRALQLVICDFGIARDNSKTTPVSYQWPVMGTPDYLSPEQCEGEPVGARSDLDAMGRIMYELLTGWPPFAGTPGPHVSMYRQVNEAPIPPRDRNPEVPESLNALTLRLLAKKPEDRPDSAITVGRELRDIRDRLRGRGGVTAPLAIGSRSLHHLGAFLLDGSGILRYHEYWPESGWEKTESMPVPADQVTAVASGSHDDRLPAGAVDIACSSLTRMPMEVFALDDQGRIWHRWYWPGKWTKWQELPGPATAAQVTAIASGSHSDREQDIVALTDGKMYHSYHWLDEGDSTPWQKMPR